MRITSLSVANYKSLRQIHWTPGPLTVVIGANASGKSNLADFHDFLSDLYRHGLAVAVARKGGYENIAHRKMRRSRGSISIEVVAEMSEDDIWFSYNRPRIPVRFTHSFSFRAENRAIRSDFRVEHELIVFERSVHDRWHKFAEIARKDDKVQHYITDQKDNKTKDEDISHLLRMFRFLDSLDDPASIPSTELILGSIGRFVPLLRSIFDKLGSIRVFQLSPTNMRDFGVPIPNPEMDRYGGNLPAVVDMLMKKHTRIWSRVLHSMTELLPGLERIDIDYTSSRTLGLFFHEKGVGRPWNVAEVSDGTMHSLALLVALYDPRSAMLILEEPENSVHTWILRNLMEAATDAAKAKQIMLTTHSRVVIDASKPNDVWVMWRNRGESNLAQLNTLEPDLFTMVDEGGLTTFEIIDTGTIPQALPPGPDDLKSES